MKKGKRILSLFLAIAMVITGVNLGGLTPVKAAEVKSSKYYQVITGMCYGCQVTIKGEEESRAENGNCKEGKGQVTIKNADTLESISTANKDGNPAQAPFTSYSVDTSDSGGDLGECGGHRNACIVFDMSDKAEMDLTNLKSAKVSLNLTDVSNTKGNKSKWYRVALYETANNPNVVATDESTYAALEYRAAGTNGEDDPGSAIWSDKTISQNEAGDKGEIKKTGTISFDVTEVFKKAYEKGDRNIVYRVQVPRGGCMFDTIKLTIDATTATKTTIKYVDEARNEIQDSKQVDVSVGSQYTYGISNEEKIIKTESGIYAYDETTNAEIAEVKENADENVINLVYKKAEVESVQEPATIYTIEGNEPIFPKQLTANTNIDGITLPVNITWNTPGEWTVGDNTVTGAAEGVDGDAANVTATVHVFACDELVDEVIAGDSGPGYPKVKLKKAYKGIIETEYDIVKTGDLATDASSISYYDQGVADNADAFGGNCTGTRFDGGKFYAQGGNGSGSGEVYPANANDRTVVYDGDKIYHVRTRIDTTNVSVSGSTVNTNGTFRVWVTDPDGVTTELTEGKAGGMPFRKVVTGIIDKVGAARKGFKLINHRISWQSGYATVQYDYRKPDGTTELAASTTSKELPATSKTIDTSIFMPKSEGSTTYVFDASKSGWDINGDGAVDTPATDTATTPAAGDTAHYIAVYKEAAFEQLTETIETETLTGKNPILPLTVKAKYAGVEEPLTVGVTWDLDKFDFNTETPDDKPLEVTGTLTSGDPIKATVHVKHAYKLAEYTFDGENPAADSTKRHADADLHGVTTTDIAGVDSGSNGVKLTGGNNGTSYVKLPNDLLQLTGADGVSKETQDDFTISMFINRKSQGNSYAMILHATEVNSGSAKGHLGFINKDTLTDMEYRIGGTTKANLQAKDKDGELIITPIDQWTHVAIVTNGSKDTAKLYLDGVLVGTVTGIVKPSELAAQNNYLGRASWNNSDYQATYDDFVVYNGLLTEEEIQKIANDRLCEKPVKDIYDNLELTLKGEGTFDKDAVTGDLNLPTTMQTSDSKTVQGLNITWESSNTSAIRTDGTVIQPSKGRPSVKVILKAKIQYGSCTMPKTFDEVTVLPGENVSFIEFDEKLAEAKAKYEEVSRDKSVYVQSTIDALNAKIKEAEAVKETEGTPDADADKVDAMTAQLQTAMDGVKAKKLSEVNKTLAAWYPLDNSDDKVKDKSKNGKDGTAASTVTFGRENGATFNGGAALANCINLPTDIEVGQQMTFAFWAKDGRGGKSNAFGIGSGDGFQDATKTDAHFFYVNTYDSDSKQLVASMNPKYWSGATNISTPAAAKDTWHHVACVLSGTKLTLYVNGRKIETKDVGHTIKEMWDADPNTRHILIGNCAYGKNPNNKDKDYTGSIRDFRIYNAPLAQEQVTEVYEYFKVPEMKYAKDDLIAEVSKKAKSKLEDDGTVTLNVTNVTAPDKKLNLPATSYGGATVTWESSDDEVIDADTGIAAIPEDDLETELTAVLTATIKIGEGINQIVDTITFNCNVHYALDISTDDLAEAIQTIEDEELDGNDYTERSWTKLQNALTAAQKQVTKPTSEQAVEDAQSNLQKAREGLVDISELRDKLRTIKDALDDLDENDYTKTSWDALQALVTAAEDVLKDEGDDAVTQDDVDEAADSLPEDTSDLVECGDRDDLDAAIEAAEALVPYEEAYDETTWQTFTAALQNAKDEQAKRVEDYAEAAQELNDAIEGLEIKEGHKLEGELKETLEGELAAAKAEAEALTSDNYEPETWDVYQKALKAFEKVLDKEKATKDEAEAAAKALSDARAGLKPVADQIPDEVKQKELTDAYEAAVKASEGKKPEAYTEESWKNYQNALAAMKKIAERLGQENNNVTKTEIDAAIAALTTAEEGLTSAGQPVDKTDLNKAIQAASKLAEKDYTAATWDAFQTALKAAKQISEKEDATQTEVESALAALNTKQAALRKVVKVSKITITADYTKLAPGKKATLKAAITPGNATNKAVTWSVDKNTQKGKYASINTKGVLTTKSKAAGKTITVTAAAQDGSGKKNTFKIKVMKGGVKSISLKAKSTKVKVKKKVTIKATVKTTSKKAKDANTKLTWKSSNTKVATVNSKGVVTGKKAGKVTITATSTDGTKKSKKIKITVSKK